LVIIIRYISNILSKVIELREKLFKEYNNNKNLAYKGLPHWWKLESFEDLPDWIS